MDVLPALAGVGYICGVQVSSYLFAGGVLSYLVLIPAIAYFGGDSLSKVVDETGKALAFNQLGASQIYWCRCSSSWWSDQSDQDIPNNDQDIWTCYEGIR